MVNIQFKELKINSISSASGVFTGTNIEVGWNSISSVNEGYGEINGDENKSAESKNIIIQPRLKKRG